MIRKYSVFFKFSRFTIPSMTPCSTRNSAVWKPSGSSCPMVWRMTLGPAKPTSAPGSAMTTSPSMAKLAVTPPMVGSVSMVQYNKPASPSFWIAAEVLAICIREMIPSCILAPPEQQKKNTGSRFSRALSMAAVIFSPTTCPMLAIRNLESQMPSTMSSPNTWHCPTVTASSKPVFSLASASFSSYPS